MTGDISDDMHLRVARVVPDVAGIEAEFDYSVPAKLDHLVRVGTIVRVQLQGRRVRGWVVDDNATPPPNVRLLEIQKVTGLGPSLETIELAGWAAHRWAGKRSFFLQTASPLRVVSSLPAAPQAGRRVANDLWPESGGVLRWPPAEDPLPLALAADDWGPALILTPSQRGAERLVRRMRESGRRVAIYPDQWAQAAAGGMSVVGTRAAAWAPMPHISRVLVLDAHDESLQSERSPTWSAVDVVVERAARGGASCLLVSPAPRYGHVHNRSVHAVVRDKERVGWAPLHVVDLRHTDPRHGLYSPQLVGLLRGEERVICVLNRKGRSHFLVCGACDEVSNCERCQGANGLSDEQLKCHRCEHVQPVICRHCSSTKFKQLRPGVSRVREDLESLALRPVGEVTGESDGLPDASVLIGTEAVLHRVGRAHAVVFLDFDHDLMAPRYRAAEDALILLARASRLVGGRKGSAIVMVQTRQPEHETIDAALHADPARLSALEEERRAQLGWPPFRALATVSGPTAESYVGELTDRVEVLGPHGNLWMLRAPSADDLADALASVRRPPRLRIEVDPARI